MIGHQIFRASVHEKAEGTDYRMREFESIHVLRTDVARTGWLENRSRKVPAQNTELPRSPVWGARQSFGAQICQKGAVDNVNRFDLGSGRISAGLARIRHVFWTFQCLQGLECGSSPTSGTCFPCSGACEPLSVHKMCCRGPFGGLFCWWPLRHDRCRL